METRLEIKRLQGEIKEIKGYISMIKKAVKDLKRVGTREDHRKNLEMRVMYLELDIRNLEERIDIIKRVKKTA